MASPQTITPPQRNLDSAFLRLPAELRNSIYELVVVWEAPIRVKALGTPDSPSHVPTLVVQPELARTCRAIRREVLPIFYGMNNFLIGVYGLCDTFLAEDWLTAIGGRNRELMRNVLVTPGSYAGLLRLRSYRPRRGTFVDDMKLVGRTRLCGEQYEIVDMGSLGL